MNTFISISMAVLVIAVWLENAMTAVDQTGACAHGWVCRMKGYWLFVGLMRAGWIVTTIILSIGTIEGQVKFDHALGTACLALMIRGYYYFWYPKRRHEVDDSPGTDYHGSPHQGLDE